MKKLVVDASVLVKLFFEEEHSETATRCMEQAETLLAPDLIWAEATNVVWKRLRRKQISEQDAMQLASEMIRVPLQIHHSSELVLDALTVAARYDRSVYDGLYVALAVKAGAVLITADRRLVNSLAPGPLARSVRWIGSHQSGPI